MLAPHNVLFGSIGNIYNASVTTQDSSSLTVAFAGGLGASSYEYRLSTTSALTGFGDWAALASTNIIGGLSASTQYWFQLRSVRGMIRGPASAPGTGTTTAGGGPAAGEPMGLLLTITYA